ncbi:MAG: transcription repressor NadR [Treponema sp.]|nr:transcription repressor NadR [Treponema sp.]
MEKKKLTGEERRTEILKILNDSKEALSGSRLSQMLGVSRQVIVTDMALLRAERNDIIATNSGYLISSKSESPRGFRRIFKVSHTDEQLESELTSIVDLGGSVLDVFIEHKVYGTISAPLNISSKRDIQNFLSDIKSGVSTPLKNITGNYHYHTVEARSEKVLDEIADSLKSMGFLIEVRESAQTYRAKDYSVI